jgi:transposase
MDTKPPLPPEIWEHTPAEAQEYMHALEGRIAVLEAMVQRLPAPVQQLTERRQQDSRTSSRPPSSDPPQATGKRPRREPSGRRPGGQPGHQGQARAMLPVEAVDLVIPVKPERCSRCQHPLEGDEPEPRQHQVTEVPPVTLLITEYQLQRLVCPVCGAATRAELPAGVPAGGFGPRVQAITALCTGAYHLSKCTTQSVREELFGLLLSLGTIANLEQATVQAVAEPVAEARAYVQQQPAAYLDETGWREGRQRAWLWTAVTAWGTVFIGRRSRSGQVAQELVGEHFWGWLITARWSRYRWYPLWRRQWCWAHLLRDSDAMIERGGRSAESGDAWRTQARLMCHWSSGLRRHVGARQLSDRHAADSAGGGTAAGGGPNLWPSQDGREVSRHPQTAAGLVDVRATCRGGPDQQCGGAGHSARGALAQGQLWDSQPGGLPVCGSDDDRRRHTQTAASACPRLCDRRVRGGTARGGCPFLASYTRRT